MIGVYDWVQEFKSFLEKQAGITIEDNTFIFSETGLTIQILFTTGVVNNENVMEGHFVLHDIPTEDFNIPDNISSEDYDLVLTQKVCDGILYEIHREIFKQESLTVH